jgi:FAD/FMN-containing dehydrogenase
MLIEVTSRNAIEPTFIEGSLADLLNQLNMAAASNHHFVLMAQPGGKNVLLETRNITRVREIDDLDAFIGR